MEKALLSLEKSSCQQFTFTLFHGFFSTIDIGHHYFRKIKYGEQRRQRRKLAYSKSDSSLKFPHVRLRHQIVYEQKQDKNINSSSDKLITVKPKSAGGILVVNVISCAPPCSPNIRREWAPESKKLHCPFDFYCCLWYISSLYFIKWNKKIRAINILRT